MKQSDSLSNSRVKNTMIKKRISRNTTYLNLLVLPILLSLIGLVFIFEASSIRSFSIYKDGFYFFKYQIIWLFVGIGLMLFFSLFNYHKLYYLAFVLMVGTILLLLFVLIPSIGSKVGGARRWIDFGFFNVQPTELAKFSVIIYLSSWLIYRERKRFFSFLILLGILMLFIIMQPDMGTAIIVFFLSVMIYFLSGMDLLYLTILIPISGLGFFLLVKLSPYRFNRLLAFFNPALDPLGITYHLNQIMISLSNGGLFGQGLGASRQKYLFLPEAHTDSIFAIVAEEIGFIGSVGVIFMYVLLLYKIYQVATHSSDRFGKLLAGGIFILFNLQILINLAGMVNLIPLTGVPLPFLSYGGSNLLISFILIGILINIAKRIKKI